MTYYLRFISAGALLEPWKIDCDKGEAIRLNSSSDVLRAEAGESIWDKLKRDTPWFESGINPFHKTNLRPGEYYPRIARPTNDRANESHGWNPGAKYERNAIAVARDQTTVLTRQLGRICQTVHPTKKTFGTYGHDIRNLLILACTEVESHLRGVSTSNGVKKRCTMRHYVSLLPAMKLDEYELSFPAFPWLEPMRPYRNWGSAGSLAWYDSYNAVKHNRESEFERATLVHVFEAISACVIMMVAQLPPETSFILIGVIPSTDPKKSQGIGVDQFRLEFSRFTFVFDYEEAKPYEIRFSPKDVDFYTSLADQVTREALQKAAPRGIITKSGN